MRKFQFNKDSSISSKKEGVLSSLTDELKAIEPEEVMNNIHHLLTEISYSCRSSVDNPHPYLVNLESACKNIGALVICLPSLIKGDKVGAILKNPEVILQLPNIDVRNMGVHAATILEAGKLYLGTHREEISNTDIARQMFSLLGQVISNNSDKGVIERTAKAFAREANDALHKLVDLTKKEETDVNNNENKPQ